MLSTPIAVHILHGLEEFNSSLSLASMFEKRVSARPSVDGHVQEFCHNLRAPFIINSDEIGFIFSIPESLGPSVAKENG